MKELNAKNVNLYETDMSTGYADESINVIKKSMETVLAEMNIILEDGTSHIVYITSFQITNNKFEYEFSTIDGSKKEVLIPHIENAFKNLLEQYEDEIQQPKLKPKWKFW